MINFNYYESIINNMRGRGKIIVSISIIFVVTALLIIPASNQAYALHLSDELKWQTVFLTSNPACSGYNYQLVMKNDKIAEKYLDMYEINNSKYDPLCFSHWKYFDEYTSPQDLDLIILVYDRNLGEQELHKYKMGGFYTHQGIDRTHNHAIVMCADCSSFYYSNPAWILTHELSHFALYYKNFDMDVIEELVHSFDDKYDSCLKSFDSSCKDVVVKLRVQAYDYSVMPIYKPAVETTNFAEEENVEVSEIVMHMAKEMTKWWTAGKITDGDYANAVGAVIDKDVISKHGNSEVLFTDGPIDDSISWEEVLDNMKNHNGEEKSQSLINKIKSKIPQFVKSEEQIIYANELISGLPDWFKTTAKWWADEEISDKEFMKTIEYLREAGIIRPHD